MHWSPRGRFPIASYPHRRSAAHPGFRKCATVHRSCPHIESSSVLMKRALLRSGCFFIWPVHLPACRSRVHCVRSCENSSAKPMPRRSQIPRSLPSATTPFAKRGKEARTVSLKTRKFTRCRGISTPGKFGPAWMSGTVAMMGIFDGPSPNHSQHKFPEHTFILSKTKAINRSHFARHTRSWPKCGRHKTPSRFRATLSPTHSAIDLSTCSSSPNSKATVLPSPSICRARRV